MLFLAQSLYSTIRLIKLNCIISHGVKMPRDVENYNTYMRNYSKNRRKNDPEFKRKQNEAVRKSQKGIRKRIIILLGSKCANPNCPIPRDKLDPRALQIDHVHGKGNEQRRKHCNAYDLYRQILKVIKSGSKDYQLICDYCNWLKEFEHEDS